MTHLTAQALHAPTSDPPDRTAPNSTVTLCGSMRFWPQMLAVAQRATQAGQVVLAPFVVVGPADQHTETGAATKAQLDLLHRRKIAMADAVLVVTDPTGYYGTSTRAEIAYARQLGLPVDIVAVDLDTGTHTVTTRWGGAHLDDAFERDQTVGARVVELQAENEQLRARQRALEHYVGTVANRLGVPDPQTIRDGNGPLEHVGETSLAEIERLRARPDTPLRIGQLTAVLDWLTENGYEVRSRVGER